MSDELHRREMAAWEDELMSGDPKVGLAFEPTKFTIREDGTRVIQEAKILAISIDKTE